MLISLSPSSKSTGARERGIVYVDIWPGRAKGRKVSLASVASPAETVVLIQPLLCFAPLLHPRRLSCVGTTSSALQQENSIVGRQKLFNHWNSSGPTPATLHAIVATLSSVHCRPVECPPDYVFVEYDRPRARRHGAQDRQTCCSSRASSRLHAQLTKLFERCLFYYTGHSHCDIFPVN